MKNVKRRLAMSLISYKMQKIKKMSLISCRLKFDIFYLYSLWKSTISK